MPSVPAGSLVLVTSGSGFLGAWTVNSALKHGFRVRTTVRSDSKGEYLKQLFSKHGDKFSYTIVEDLEKPGAFDEAVKDVSAVVHTGSPFHFDVQGDPYKHLIHPAVNGTLSVLKAAHEHGKEVKRIVITSSYAAVVDSNNTKDVLTVEDWNETDPKTVEKDPKNANGLVAYRASKSLAEKAMWDFIEKSKPSFDAVSVCPPMIFGPIIHQVDSVEKLNTSSKFWFELIQGKKDESTLANPGGNCVDVRDTADVHILALTTDKASNQRMPSSLGQYTYQRFADAVHSSKKVPDAIKQKTPKGNPGTGQPKQKTFDGSKSVDLLPGFKYRDYQIITDDSVEAWLDYEKRGWKGVANAILLDL